MNLEKVKNIIEAALMVADEPLPLDRLQGLFPLEHGEQPGRDELRQTLEQLQQDYVDRGIELVQVGSGYRFQSRNEHAEWVNRIWSERPPRYSRALLETLVIIAYRQPITRAEIEDIRGVSVSSNIVKTLLERDWVRIAGHRDVPGRPAVFASTKGFLDYFSLKSLADLPSLSELRDLDDINPDLFADQKGDIAGQEGSLDNAMNYQRIYRVSFHRKRARRSLRSNRLGR